MSRRWDDDELLGQLRDALAEETDVPERAQEMARMAFAWRDVVLELELLTLVHDSALHEVDGIRGQDASAPRVLVFESEALTLEVEVGETTLTCHVVPALPGRLVVQAAGGEEYDGETDDGGFYLVRRPEGSPLRLTWAGAETRMVTDWFPV